MIITRTERDILLRMAFHAISGKIDPGNMPSSPAEELTETLKNNCGAFASVYVKQELRGCIGTFSEDEALYKNVKKMAVSAAFEDTRYTSIHADELAQLEIEISVLTPRQRIYDPAEIVLGKHGIYMRKGSYRGTLLPQVAVKQNWTVKEFLGSCSKYKAGIGWDGWKTAELYTYEAIVFSSKFTI